LKDVTLLSDGGVEGGATHTHTHTPNN